MRKESKQFIFDPPFSCCRDGKREAVDETKRGCHVKNKLRIANTSSNQECGHPYQVVIRDML